MWIYFWRSRLWEIFLLLGFAQEAESTYNSSKIGLAKGTTNYLNNGASQAPRLQRNQCPRACCAQNGPLQPGEVDTGCTLELTSCIRVGAQNGIPFLGGTIKGLAMSSFSWPPFVLYSIVFLGPSPQTSHSKHDFCWMEKTWGHEIPPAKVVEPRGFRFIFCLLGTSFSLVLEAFLEGHKLPNFPNNPGATPFKVFAVLLGSRMLHQEQSMIAVLVCGCAIEPSITALKCYE